MRRSSDRHTYRDNTESSQPLQLSMTPNSLILPNGETEGQGKEKRLACGTVTLSRNICPVATTVLPLEPLERFPQVGNGVVPHTAEEKKNQNKTKNQTNRLPVREGPETRALGECTA